MTERAPEPVELSDLLRRRALGGERVTELLVHAHGAAWPVRAAIADGATREVRWRDGRIALGDPVGEADLVGLKESILDRQVVDLDDRQVVRIGDVALLPVHDRLEVVALELGLRPVLRRIGLRRIAEGRRENLLRLEDVTVEEACIVAHAQHKRVTTIEAHHLARLIRRLPHRMQRDVLAQLPEQRQHDIHAHIKREPHRPRLRRYRVPDA